METPSFAQKFILRCTVTIVFLLLGSPVIQLFRVFPAVKLSIKQMFAFVSMDTAISRSCP